MESEEGVRFLNRIGKLILGGSFIPEKLEQQLQQLETEIWHTYGMTETITHIALRKVNGNDASRYFKLLPGVEIQLTDDACLQINAPQLGVFSLKTNDRVEISKNGFQLLGRQDNVVNSGGLKLFPEQIEKKLEGLFENAFFLTGIPDEKYGEKLVMVVEEKADAAVEERLWKLIHGRLSAYEIPRAIIFTDKIRINNNGKLIRSLPVP
jgi:O-succinylbenzoic acid--CoA ligase